MSYSVPRPIFEAIHSSLYAAGRAFVRSLAEDVLEIPPADLLRRVLPSKEAYNMVLYETEEVNECYACIPHPTQAAVILRCRRPIVPGEQFCRLHKYDRPALQPQINAQTWNPLNVGPDLPPLWFNESTGCVINADNIECGTYDYDSGRLVLFDFEDEDSA